MLTGETSSVPCSSEQAECCSDICFEAGGGVGAGPSVGRRNGPG